MRLRHVAPLVAALVCAALSPSAQAAPTITEFAAGTGAAGVAAGPDGNVWFTTTPNPGSVGHMSTSGGALTTFASGAGLSNDAKPTDITAGAGNLWVTENAKNKIARITTGGTVTEFTGASHGRPTGITFGPDGNLWYTAQASGGAIVRMTPTGTLTQYTAGLTTNGNPQDIVVGPDGNLWFTAPATGRIGRITPQGVITEFATGITGAPQEITAGPDGNLWFTETGLLTSAIGRISTTGTVTEFTTGLSLTSAPQGITAGADGNLYFTDGGANVIGQVTTSGTITTFSAGLSSLADLQDITSAPDGRLWFAEATTGKLGQMTIAPTAGAVSASDVTDVTATVTAAVRPNSQATTTMFEWGTTTSYGHSTTPGSPISGGTAQAVSDVLTGLSPSTTYHVRGTATNATGTTYGPDRTFTTTAAGAPSATTTAATGVGPSAATLTASVNPENATTTYHFDYGTSTSYSDRAPVAVDGPVGSDGVDHPESESLTGLQPNTTYHFRIVATSGSGTTVGDDATFTTDAVVPSATTSPATAITADSATLSAAVDPRNSATAYHFDWGTTSAFGTSLPDLDELVGADHTPHTVTQPLTGLAPNTTYHVQVVATSNAGVATGGEQTFTTAGVAPGAATSAADGISTSAATLHGTVNPRNSTTTYHFDWGATAAYGQATLDAGLPGPVDLNARDVTGAITGLQAGAVYHFRVVASSASGTTIGADQTFTAASNEAPAAPADADPAPTDPVPAGLQPELGRAAVASAVAGSIRFRLPGTTGWVPLDGAATIPSGATIDAGHGTLEVTSAVDAAGRTQSARFRGTTFRLALSRLRPGMVDISVVQRAADCTTRPPRAHAARASKTAPMLWAKDARGKYRTHGRNSVATVRGTEWTTIETCTGTLTRVIKGAVSVWDRRDGRHHVVHAGHTHLARPGR